MRKTLACLLIPTFITFYNTNKANALSTEVENKVINNKINDINNKPKNNWTRKPSVKYEDRELSSESIYHFPRAIIYQLRNRIFKDKNNV